VLRRLEAFVFFLAMMLVIVLEGGVVYWIFHYPLPQRGVHGSLVAGGEWTGVALPQAWLFGALLVLAYRTSVTFIPPTGWSNSDRRRNRTALLDLWKWTVALIAIQGLAIFLGNANAS
jgi:hypothetical protein